MDAAMRSAMNIFMDVASMTFTMDSTLRGTMGTILF
jgi:hypothetical protein